MQRANLCFFLWQGRSPVRFPVLPFAALSIFCNAIHVNQKTHCTPKKQQSYETSHKTKADFSHPQLDNGLCDPAVSSIRNQGCPQQKEGNSDHPMKGQLFPSSLQIHLYKLRVRQFLEPSKYLDKTAENRKKNLLFCRLSTTVSRVVKPMEHHSRQRER